MSEPKNNFVEMIEVWKSSPNAYPVAVIIYDSNGGIEVQLGRKISGSRDHFKIITSKGDIVEIQRTATAGFTIVKGEAHNLIKKRTYYE